MCDGDQVAADLHKCPDARKGELDSHCDHDQPHETGYCVADKSARAVRIFAETNSQGNREQHHQHAHKYGYQGGDGKLMPRLGNGKRNTPVIVPGLAAKRISGVSDRFSFAAGSPDRWEPVGAPRNIPNPIQASTPPPATMKASNDTPNTPNSRWPKRAASTRITRTASRALPASANCARAAGRPRSAKIAAHV